MSSAGEVIGATTRQREKKKRLEPLNVLCMHSCWHMRWCWGVLGSTLNSHDNISTPGLFRAINIDEIISALILRITLFQFLSVILYYGRTIAKKKLCLNNTRILVSSRGPTYLLPSTLRIRY